MHTLIIINFNHFKNHDNTITKYFNSVKEAITGLILFDNDTTNEFRFLNHDERTHYTSSLDNACEFFKKYGYEFMHSKTTIIQSESEITIKDNIETKVEIPDLINDKKEPKQVEHTYIRKENCSVVIPLILIDDGSDQSTYKGSIDDAIIDMCTGSIIMTKLYLKLSLKEKKKVTSSIENAYNFITGVNIYRESDDPYFERSYYPFKRNYKLKDAPKPSKNIINKIDDSIEFQIKKYENVKKAIEPLWNQIDKVKF